MREIKFRCRDKEAKGMFEFDLFDEEGYNEKLGTIPLDDSQVVMQYTGLKDRNGKEIYEGDILKTYAILASDFIDSKPIHCPVRRGDGGWVSNGSLHSFQATISEVVGNIRENPELAE